MPSLPRFSGQKVVQVFTKFGWQVVLSKRRVTTIKLRNISWNPFEV